MNVDPDTSTTTERAHDGRPIVDLMFHLSQSDGWPPFPAERIAARLIAADRAELVGIPMYADGLSLADTVRLTRDGAGFVGEEVVSGGGHSTVRVAAIDATELTALQIVLDGCGFSSMMSDRPAVLAVDVAPDQELDELLGLLDLHTSMRLTYAISCRRHRAEGDDAATETAGSARFRGRIVRPGDPDWDTARTAWNLAVDQRPELIAEVADAFDVQTVVRYAAARGLRVAPQSTGHNATPLGGELAGAILLRTGRMREVDVDVAARSVRVGAGAIWDDVTQALAPHGLVALAGSAADVGVAGYALGGGYSWLGRRHGLASSSMTAVELVTGDGRFHRVDADNEPDLFWAVRGGGANIGVVTAMEFDVLPITEIYAGALLFPLDRVREVLPAYEAWTRDLDESVTSCVRFLRLPPLPELPEPLRGNAFVVVDGAIDAPASEAAELLAPLRDLGPIMDIFGPMPASQLATIHMDPPQPVPGVGDGLSLVDLTPEAIDRLITHAGPGVDSSLLALDIRHLGGALGRADARGGVVDHLPGRFALFAVGVAPTPEVAGALHREIDTLIESMQPWAAERDYSNFREVRVPAERLYGSADLDRLRELRAEHDPAGILTSNHPID